MRNLLTRACISRARPWCHRPFEATNRHVLYANGTRMTDYQMRFEGKTAMVTGGSRGIGRACVAQLAAEGAEVAFVYHSNQEAAEALVAELAATAGQVRALQADVRDCRPGPADRRSACRASGSRSTSWSTRRASSRTGCWAR